MGLYPPLPHLKPYISSHLSFPFSESHAVSSISLWPQDTSMSSSCSHPQTQPLTLSNPQHHILHSLVEDVGWEDKKNLAWKKKLTWSSLYAHMPLVSLLPLVSRTVIVISTLLMLRSWNVKIPLFLSQVQNQFKNRNMGDPGVDMLSLLLIISRTPHGKAHFLYQVDLK